MTKEGNAMTQIKNILYLGWLGKANVGDEVLFELFKTMFYKYYESNDKNVAINIDTYPNNTQYEIDLSTYNLIVLGGGSLLNLPYYLNVCEEGIKKGIPVVSWGTGVDGMYRLNDINTIKIPDENFEHFKSVYEKFDYLSVRGPFTNKMFVNSGFNQDIHEIGDPALVYAKEVFGDQFAKIDNVNKNILINWGTSFNNIFGNDELQVEDELAATIRKLISMGYTITVYPIWTEDIEPVQRLVQKVNDYRCRALTKVYEAKILQCLVSQSYMSINLKLHANIFSASANRPFISLAYRGKCFDFAKSVNCEEYAIATDEVSSQKLIELVKRVENNYSKIVEIIEQAKNKYYPQLLKSIDEISKILDNQTAKKVQVSNEENLIPSNFSQVRDSNIIKRSTDLTETILEGLAHIQTLFSQGKFEQSIYMFEDICEAFYVIEKSVSEIFETLKDDVAKSSLESIKSVLRRTISAYEENNLIYLEEVLLHELKNNFERFYGTLNDISKVYLN